MAIALAPNSLFVTTTQLSETKFHWALVRTDDMPMCNATRHHWHEKPRASSDNSAPIEGYGIQNIQPRSLTGRVVLGYFQIANYSAPAPGVFEEICESTFPTSFATVWENRQRGITCRTFVLNVLSELCSRGYITGWRRTDEIPSFVASLEKTIVEQSRRADCSYLTRFYNERVLTWASPVVVI
ncbi:hypothetical protein HMN09_00046400 [Mycena chlorophos]|uniref:Uncharacterized protein n=1 Tax=Mycena chlorophos TaxID=658473 RepID=A0A8H6TTV5_MYCCL|nr:hypothetical protein HMN09_00046400 [Mycena chlorophos]